MSNRLTCPKCGMLTLRPGAVKCSACKAWVGPQPRRPLSGPRVALLLLALTGPGMMVGAAALTVAASLWARGVSLPWVHGGREAKGEEALEDSAPAAPPAASGASEGGSAPPASSGPNAAAPGEAALFSEPRVLRVSVGPVDVAISDDDATLFVLGDDGTLRVLELGSGKEIRKVPLLNRGTELRLLAGKYLAVLGAMGMVPIVDLTTYVVGRIDLGGAAVDVVALESPPVLIAATAGQRKVARVAVGSFRVEGQIVLPRPVSGLVRMPALGEREGSGERKAGAPEMLAVLTQGKPTGGLGAVEIFDPTAAPFGASRSTWITAVDPRPGAVGEASVFVVDRSAGQLLEVSRERPPRVASVGQGPLSAYRLLDRWVVTVDAAGTATVLAADTLETQATIPLGDIPTDAAVTPDHRALLVALGGGPRDRGATTAVLAGDPPRLVGKLSTGAGSRRVRLSKGGRLAAVAAYFGRSVAILERR